LIEPRRTEYTSRMAVSDDNYVLDRQGNQVLIGLTIDETREFERLDDSIFVFSPLQPFSTDERRLRSRDQKRWLALYEKHQAALRPFLTATKTRH
jgi:hypothetical protein